MNLKPQIESIIYAVEEPVTLDQLVALLRDYIGVREQQGRVALDSDFNESSAIAGHHALAAFDGFGDDSAQSTADPHAVAAYDGYGDDNSAQSTDDAQTDAAAESRGEDDTERARNVSAGKTSTQGESRRDDTNISGDNAELAPKHALRDELKRHRQLVLDAISELVADYAHSDRGIEIREVAGGYRMSTKPEHHDLVRAFASGLKPPIKLSLPALETLAVIAYKQPVTAPEISEIRGVDTSGVLANLISRKLITTAGRKPVIGRPILYKTTKEFLLRFGLKDLAELPTMEEFEKLTSQSDLFDNESERSEGPARSAIPETPSEPDPFSVE